MRERERKKIRGMVKQPLPNLLVLALSVFAKKADRVVVNIEFSPE